MVDTTLDQKILEKLSAPFDAKDLRKKQEFSYIPEPVVRQRLQDVLGLNWDFTITSEIDTTFRSEPAIVVRGQLTVYLPSGRTITREGYGGSPLKNGMAAGDAHKGAASNALKKAAYLFGVGAYLGLKGNSLESIDDTTSWGNAPTQSTPNSGWVNNNNSAPAEPAPVAAPVVAPIQGGNNNQGGWGQ